MAVLLALAPLIVAGNRAIGDEQLEIRSRKSESGAASVDVSSGAAEYSEGVVVRYNDGKGRRTVLNADRARIDPTTGDIEASGDVSIETVEDHGGQVPKTTLWRGEQIQYNLRTRAITAHKFRMGEAPFFVTAESMTGIADRGGEQVLTDATLATEDLATPSYKIRLKELGVQPGKRIRGRAARVTVGERTLLPLPKYERNLQKHDRFWEVTPGYRSVYGPFLLTAYNWNLRTNLNVGLELDYRQKRGAGFGPFTEYDFGKWGQGEGQFYFTRDDLPPKLDSGEFVRRDRHRVQYHHSATNSTGFSFKAVVREQSDPLIVHDFFEGEFRRNPRPPSFVEANQAWSNWTLDLLAQPQLNDYWETVERLPDVKLTGLRQQLGATPLYYDSESSLGYLRYRSSAPGGTNYAAFRADTYHQITWPQVYLGWLNFMPRVGGRMTHYGDPDGLSRIQEDQQRAVLNTGAEINFKAARVWPGATNRTLAISGIRHIVMPSVNYVYVPEPNRRPPDLPQFDRELPSLRLLPVDFPDYNSIDSVDSQNVIRLGLKNKLQTKRAGQVEDVVQWRVMTDWRLRPEPGQTTFPELYSDLDFSPRSWIILNSELRYDLNRETWRESTHRVTLLPNDVWNWTVGHRYLVRNPEFQDLGNNLVFSSIYYRANENWAFRLSHHFEGRDGVMEEQSYTVYRDLRSWTAALSFRLRDNRLRGDDWAIVLSFSLKAFPSYRLNSDRDIPERLFGG